MRKPIAAAAVLVLTGCNTTSNEPPTAAAAADIPANHRSLVVAKVRQEFVDPYSIRDATISQPFYWQSIYGSRAAVCMRANAKNRMGGYAGQRASLITFSAGQIVGMTQEYADIACADKQFEPFTELEGGGQPAVSAATKR